MKNNIIPIIKQRDFSINRLVIYDSEAAFKSGSFFNQLPYSININK